MEPIKLVFPGGSDVTTELNKMLLNPVEHDLRIDGIHVCNVVFTKMETYVEDTRYRVPQKITFELQQITSIEIKGK